MADPGPLTFHPARLEAIRNDYGDVHTYTFRTETPLPFIAGQHVHLAGPGLEVCKPNVRHMSVASAPGDELLQFSMDLASHSDYKEAFRRSKPGDTTQIFKIGGEFTVDPADPSPLVFIAGGIGITPFRSLIRDLEQKGRPRPWSLFHVSRDAFLYEAEFTPLPFPQLRTGRAGVPEALAALLEANPQGLWYLCGSRSFLEGLLEHLGSLGVPADRIRTEDFR
nr:FAD-dependent oxidoreductase [uncultured Holophaga sp.]